jgi:hypothetical protein
MVDFRKEVMMTGTGDIHFLRPFFSLYFTCQDHLNDTHISY